MNADNKKRERHYWLYRIDTSQIEYFKKQLDRGILRQGWGWDPGQDLRVREVDEGAFRNIGIYERVKKGDILLVPSLPDWDKVSIVEATEDFDKGYDFRPEHKAYTHEPDYGHMFPAKLISTFVRSSELVSANLRSAQALSYRLRFKWIYYEGCAQEIKKLIDASESQRHTSVNAAERATAVISAAHHEAFDENVFQEKLWNGFNNQNWAGEWELALVFMLQQKFPYYNIEKTGGRNEQYHGTDILISLPGLTEDYRYAIAIQVKDYKDIVGKGVIDQIKKAENWNTHADIRLIDKIVIITNAEKDENRHLIQTEITRSDREIKFIFAQELRSLLCDISKGMQLDY